MTRRLIDADALKAEFFSGGDGLWHPVAIGIEIDIAPTIDAVEVVRCKDCVYWQDNNGGYPHEDCKWGHEETPDAEDYCSFGERRKDE